MLLELVLEIPSFKPFQDQRMFAGWAELGGFFKAGEHLLQCGVAHGWRKEQARNVKEG